MRRPGEELFAGAKPLRLNGVWHVRERPVVMLDEDEEGISGFKWENNVPIYFSKITPVALWGTRGLKIEGR